MNLFSYIKSRTPILDVVQEYCTLKKAGSYWKGPCPFHSERTASFTVSPHKDIFYCFGCHQGGDVISFIATLERCSQKEAADFLIERYNLEIPEQFKQATHYDKGERHRYEKMCELITIWCQEQLKPTTEAHAYLVGRGFIQASLDAFSIGYFPRHGLAALQGYLSKHHIMLQDLKDIHFVMDGKQGLYTPFEERIIFPIKDHSGRVVAFGGRIFKQHDDRPKYYNSHETTYFNKSATLYGLHRAKQAIKNSQRIILVEGYLDVMALHQSGYQEAVATLGTACTEEHLKLLSRYAQKLIIMYDGDKAGKQAAIRLIRLALDSSVDVLCVTLPAGEDPASCLAHQKPLSDLLSQAEDMMSFVLHEKSADIHKKSVNERLVIIDELLQLFSSLDDHLKKNMFLQRISEQFQVPLSLLIQRTQRSPGHPPSHAAAEQPQTEIEHLPSLEKKIFSAILKLKSPCPEIDELCDEQFIQANFPPTLARLYSVVQHARTDQGTVDMNHLLSLLNEQDKRIISELLIDEDHEAPQTISLLLEQFLKKQWKLMVNDVKMELAHGNARQGDSLQKKLHELQIVQKKLIERGLI